MSNFDFIATYVDLSDSPTYTTNITLEGQLLKISFVWNERIGKRTIFIRNSADICYLQNTILHPNESFELNSNAIFDDLPYKVVLHKVGDTNKVGNIYNWSKDFILCFYRTVDVETEKLNVKYGVTTPSTPITPKPFSPPYNLIVEFKNDETNRLELNWKLDGFVDEQRYYCSEIPIDLDNLPAPKVILAGDVRTYVDTDIEIGKTYHMCISSVKNGVEKCSEIKLVRVGDEYRENVVALLRFEDGIIDDTGRIWNTVGSPVVSNGQLVLNGSSGLITDSSGFDFGTGDFTIEAFLLQNSPSAKWREIFMANAGYQINFLLFNKMLVIGREGVANDYSSSFELTQGQMSHIAVSRKSGVVRGFINGNKVFEGPYTHNFSSSAPHSIGAHSNGVNGFVGSIEQFRVTNGVGRYTSDFVPQDFPNI